MGIYINQSGTAKRMDGAGDGSLYAPVTSIATPENGSTASKAYAVGEMFIRDGKLCTCTVAIGAGGSFAKGTNYVEGSVGEVLRELNSNLGAKVSANIEIVNDYPTGTQPKFFLANSPFGVAPYVPAGACGLFIPRSSQDAYLIAMTVDLKIVMVFRNNSAWETPRVI